MADISIMSGRWLWCGSQIFTEAQWDTLCSLATSWKIQGIHPKCADGIHPYYDDAGMQMLKSIAEKHGLKCAPYHYCYGPKFGAVQIATEAQISAHIGSIFGAVIPDIEDEYMSQYDAAISFAKQVRALYSGLWIPTMYANCITHPTPLLALNPFIDAWLPQVYFSVWTGIAQDAINYVFPQWHAIDAECKTYGQEGLKPTLPIISTTNNVASNQIVDFIEKMQRYGYIGFWHSGTYEPYASAVQTTPIPTLENTMSNTDQLQAAGWKYDAQQKQWTAPNECVVVLGFADAVSKSWDPQDYPLENEQHLDQLEVSNPALGGGSRQRFRMTTLEWTPARGVFKQWTGQELIALEQEVHQLQAQLQTLQNPPPVEFPRDAQTAIIDAIHQVAGIAQELQTVGTALQSVLPQ